MPNRDSISRVMLRGTRVVATLHENSTPFLMIGEGIASACTAVVVDCPDDPLRRHLSLLWDVPDVTILYQKADTKPQPTDDTNLSKQEKYCEASGLRLNCRSR